MLVAKERADQAVYVSDSTSNTPLRFLLYLSNIQMATFNSLGRESLFSGDWQLATYILLSHFLCDQRAARMQWVRDM